MASFKHQSSLLNLSQDKSLGFGLPQSNPQFNWRNNPSIVHCRDYVKQTIQCYLAQNSCGEFQQQIAMLATYLESQLFSNALSEDDYMDREKCFARVQNIISQRWSEVKSAQQEAELTTNFTIKFDRPIVKHITSPNVGFNVTQASNYSVDVPIGGSQNCIMDTTLCQPESILPIDCPFGMAYFNAEPSDSGTTYIGCDLQYGPETPLEILGYKSQNFPKGEITKVNSVDQTSPSLHTPDVAGKNLNFVPVLPDYVHVHQPIPELSQSEPKLSHSQPHFDDRFGEFSSLGSLSMERTNLCGPAITSTTSTIPPGQEVVKLLCWYAQHKNRANEVPFLEFIHSQMCKDGICCCERYKFWFSHYDNCGSTHCKFCAHVRKLNSENFLTQPENISGKRVCGYTFDDYMNPSKSRKLNTSPLHDSSSDVSALTEEPISPSGPLMFEQLSVYPITTTVTNPIVNEKVITSPSMDASRSDEADINALDDAKECKLGDSTIFSENLHADFQLKDERVMMNHNDDNGTLYDDIQRSNANCGNHFDNLSGNITKSEKLTVEGVSLIDYFTVEEVRQHIASLSLKEDQDAAEKIMATRGSCSLSENSCQLCGMEKLAFAPMPIYCSSCGARIKNHASYYSTDDKCSSHFCFCTTCYNKCHRGIFTFQGVSVTKSSLTSKRNDVVTVEPWVQCDRCEGWQHQICALFNDKKDLGGKAEYLCPLCHLKDLECGKRMPLSRSTSLDANNLPHTLLSNRLEERLSRCLKKERESRAKASGMNLDEVAQPADLFVRVVSAVDKILKVKQQFLDIFPEKNYPAEFPYRSKVILLFQRIDGADVCLFAMYVQEFGSDCSQPNQRCVYISYLDSVKYFRPEIKTVKGEALRTFVYHEILVGYLEYCKKRGFATCYIWACPPVKGEDYILYCHPETQKTPKPDKLRQWYQSMLKKAIEEKVVVNFSNLYEKFFVPTGESNTKVTAARLPYFDGDYWSSVADNMIKKIELESGGDPQQQVKKITRRSLKAMGHSNPSADDAKDILLMQALAQNISSAKEDFIIVYLHFICAHCDEVILSGQRWFCNQCKNYQLCGRCHDLCEQSGPGNTHISSAGQTHALSQEIVNDVPVDTEDNDVIMDKCFLENRHTFLSFCQGNHYQFDLLRRGKHSSMMILHHLHNLGEFKAGTFCSLCLKDNCGDPRWICEICPEFSICSSCHERSDVSCHIHSLTYLPIVAGSTKSKAPVLINQLLEVLQHASQCQTTISQECSYPNCMDLKRLFCHTHACNIRVPGGCRLCKKTWFILLMHSQRCKDPTCHIPRCMDLKNHVKRPELKPIAKEKKMLPGLCGRSIL